MNHGIPVDLLQYNIEIFVQSEKMDQERFFNPLVEKEISSLPERKNPIRGMNDVGIENFSKSKKLPTF
jgi:hypothetical protein